MRLWNSLVSDKRGVGFIEFALALPLVLGFCLSGLELANCLLQINKAQRVASMLADLMSQQGQGSIEATERQVYDLFAALKVSASPIDMTRDGRVVLTVVRGTASGSSVVNEFVNQQFEGGLVSAQPALGCHSSVSVPTFDPARTLALDEILIHAQVTFDYRPLFFTRAFDMLNLPDNFTRFAAYRARRSDFAIQPQPSHPMKTNCATVDGLPTMPM